LRRAKYRKEQRRRRLPSVARGGDYAQRAATDPAAAAFVTKAGTPSSTANYLASRAPAVGDRSGTNNQQDPRAILERVVHRDEAIGIDDYFLGQLLRVEGRVEGAAFFIAARPCNSAVEDTRQNRAGLGDFRDCSHHEITDDVRRFRCASGHDSRLRPVDSCEDVAIGCSDYHAGLRTAPVDTDDDLTHFRGLPALELHG